MVKHKRNVEKIYIFPAIISGINSVGMIYPSGIKPIKYKRGYNHDMKMIGLDMRKAEEKTLISTFDE